MILLIFALLTTQPTHAAKATGKVTQIVIRSSSDATVIRQLIDGTVVFP